jgi:hypothetical protein
MVFFRELCSRAPDTNLDPGDPRRPEGESGRFTQSRVLDRDRAGLRWIREFAGLSAS